MRYIFGLFLMVLTSCGVVTDMEGPVKPMGDFALGFAVGVAPHPTKGPASREASNEDLGAALKSALNERFSRFEGGEGKRLYNIGASIDGYVLAQPGIPVVLSPKSVMVVRVTIWDDALKAKMNEEPFTVTAVEELSGKSALGSGLTMTAEEQLASLARVVASDLEYELRKRMKSDKWFDGFHKTLEGYDPASAAEASEDTAEPKEEDEVPVEDVEPTDVATPTDVEAPDADTAEAVDTSSDASSPEASSGAEKENMPPTPPLREAISG